MDNPAPESAAPDPQPAPERARTGSRDLIVVGVGASAGGLEAFSELLRYLPPDTGMAFVLVQHLDPHHQSVLPELLAVKTQMQVLQVQNDTPIQPDHVYVIPPNSQMRIRDRRLVLESRPSTLEGFKPIDVFFHSLAEELHFNAVGIVLSGTASDGTLGLTTIKAEGGITFAQNQTAKFDSMPRNAVAAGAVDFVLPPRRIAEELVAISCRSGRLAGAGPALDENGATLHRILSLLRNSTGVDFTQYKQPTVLRRLNRRMVLRKVEDLEQYFDILQKEAGEGRALFDDLLINVTNFFRDPEVFETAKRVAFPSMVKGSRHSKVIRAWIPGCSTGEEVYSMAIALVEFLEAEDLTYGIQMFGTDVSDTTVDRARTGIYTESAVANVSPERLKRFFVRSDSGYQISRAIRELCVFSRHNVAKDPPLSRMDLISCRNLLIYLSPSLQRRVVATFGYALQPGGCLVLGSSETLGNLSEYFETLDEPHKIYSRKANVARNIFQIPEVADYGTAPAPALSPPPPPPGSPAAAASQQYSRVMLTRYGLVGVIVNEALQITDYRGDVSEFIEAKELDPGLDLMSVLRPDLRAPISAAVEQARRNEMAVAAENITALALDNRVNPVAITVVPLSLAGLPMQFLILLGRIGETVGLREPPSPAESKPPETVPISPAEENALLRQELKSTREYLQSVIEELRSANEEAQSANEELQSTNEEVQTSKEELQSSNEELNTINTEMQSRNTELKQLNDDLSNLLSSMHVPFVMTGADLRIRRFTPMAEKALRLIAGDIGRPIADLKPRINVPDLEEILQQVLDSLQPYEREVQDQDGRSYLMRVRPYRTSDNRIDGTVLQLLDVTELKRSLAEVKHSRDYAEAIVNTVRQPLAVLDEDLALQNANPAFFETLDGSHSAVLGKSIFEVARSRFDLPPIRALFKSLREGAVEVNDVEIEHPSERGEVRALLVNARRLRAPDQKQLILIAFEDITERKRAAEARYRRLFESARDGIVLVDAASGAILDLNPFTERLLGYPRDQIVGKKLWEIEAMQPEPRVRAGIEQIRDQGVLRFDDVTLRTRDGREIQVEVVANIYTEGNRRAIQFNMRDITERKKFERELQETQKFESLGMLAGGIAHDFNNLLTGILGNASLAMLEVAPDAPARLRLRQIMDASERAAFLTKQMLAYAGKGHFIVSRLHLGELIQEISSLLRTSIPNSVDLHLDLAADLPAIDADSVQMQQVLMNLVTNAAEAMTDGPGKVTIRTSARGLDEADAAEFFQGDRAAAGRYVQLEVVDNGQGMDEATKARIFDPFFSTKFTGRGLGLAAVQGIVRSHRGAIRVYSTPGKGSTFLVLLPARMEAAAESSGESAQSIPAGSVTLVIDDESTVRRLVESALARAGVTVLQAENGKIGVDLFRRRHREISVVLLDLQMPVMGGGEALAELRRIDPYVPVILSTGFDEAEAERRYGVLEHVRFLQKPYTASGLIEAVAAAVKARR